MPEGQTETGRNRWWAAMVRDPQFWVPVAVLLAGVILLSFIQ